MLIKIKTLKNENFEVEVKPGATVFDLKVAISLINGVPPGFQKTIFVGKILKDDDVLQELKIKPTDYVVLMVQKKAATETEGEVSESKSLSKPIPDEEFSKNLDEWSKNCYEKGKEANSFEENKLESTNDSNYSSTKYTKAKGDEGSEISTKDSGDEGLKSKKTKAVSFMELVDNPLFPLIKEAVQKNPEIFKAILNQISNKSPEVYQVISQNKQEFLDLLMKDD